MLSLTVAIGAIALAGIYWGFWEYGAGFVASSLFINDAPAERLAALRPSNELRVDTFGWMLDLLLLVYGLSIRKIVQWRHRVNARFGRTALASALMVPAFTLLFWKRRIG